MLRLVSRTLILCTLVVLSGVGVASAQVGILEYGDTVTGTVSGDSFDHTYRFVAQAGDVVTISLVATSGDLDTLLILADESANFITQDDDSGEGRNSLVRSFAIPSDGIYRIVATRYDRAEGTTVGDYELTLVGQSTEAASEFGAPPDLGDTPYQVIAYGDAVTGSISDDAWAQVYAFKGRASETISLTVSRTEGDLALRMDLLDNTGQTSLVETEDTSGAGVLQITHTLPETAYYVVGIGRAGGETGPTAGDYALTLDIASDELAPSPAIDITLSWNSVADLDLVLYYPSEESAAIDWQNIADPDQYPLPEGAAISGDANGFCQDRSGQPSERITWEADMAPEGDYEILVLYQFACGGSEEPVDFELAVTVDGKAQSITGAVEPPKGEFRTAFRR